MNLLKPIKLLPARERVASVLRKAILSHELQAGSIITLDGIASQLEVSITPVREAFQILVREGLLKQLPSRGMEVQEISPKFIRDLYETRALLESHCAAEVCRKGADTSEIASIHHKSEQALARGDVSKYSNLNQAFHFAIWDAAGNEKIKALLSDMWSGLSMGYEVTEEQYAKISIIEHEAILGCLLSGDAQGAEAHMKVHLMRSMENMLTHYT